jgi:hypothetical protein
VFSLRGSVVCAVSAGACLLLSRSQHVAPARASPRLGREAALQRERVSLTKPRRLELIVLEQVPRACVCQELAPRLGRK